MEIRPVRDADDRFSISHVYEESWKSAYQGIIPKAYLDAIPSGRWVHSVDDPARHSLLMLDGGDIIGTASYGPSRFLDRRGYGEIVSIYLLPEYFGWGYGTQLLQSVMSELGQMGYPDIFLWVLEENTRARRFYERHGFQDGHTYLDDHIGGKALREMQYVYHTGR